MNTRRAIFAALALAVTPIAASAQDFGKGLSAYQRGDFKTAIQEWRPLAEQGAADAQFFLGLMYGNGEGVPEDDAEAVRWYRLAADQGNALAQYNLGLMYYDGEGVPEDDAEAVRWFRRAADQGDAFAQYNLGYMYDVGDGVPQNYVAAHMWSNIAAANGEELGRENRDVLERRMTAEDISEAQRRARVCFASGYKDCGS